jgi:hypothetical protein
VCRIKKTKKAAKALQRADESLIIILEVFKIIPNKALSLYGTLGTEELLCGGGSFISLLSAYRHVSRERQIFGFVCVYIVTCSWSVTLEEVRGFKVFEKCLVRRIFESKRGEIRGTCRQFRNKEVYKLNSLTYIITC